MISAVVEWKKIAYANRYFSSILYYSLGQGITTTTNYIIPSNWVTWGKGQLNSVLTTFYLLNKSLIYSGWFSCPLLHPLPYIKGTLCYLAPVASKRFKTILCGKGHHSVTIFVSGSRSRQKIRKMVKESISHKSMVLDELSLRFYIVDSFIYLSTLINTKHILKVHPSCL